MARCVKLVVKDGTVPPFTQEASLPCARDADGELGSLGLGADFIFYINVDTDNGRTVETRYEICGYIHIPHLLTRYIAHCTTHY